MYTPEQAQLVARVFTDMLDNESKITRKIVAALPENQLEFKLGDKGRTARELAWHVLSGEVWFAERILKGSFDMGDEAPAPGTVAEMLAYYDRTVPALLDKVKAMPAADLAKTVPFFGMELPNVTYIGFWLNHTVHHRGQLSTYLRAMNAYVPAIYAASADEPFQMDASTS